MTVEQGAAVILTAIPLGYIVYGTATVVRILRQPLPTREPAMPGPDDALRTIHAVGLRHDAATVDYGDEVKEFLRSKPVKRLFLLLERAVKGNPNAAAEGAERLSVTLAVILGLVEHVRACNAAAGLADPPDLMRAFAGLTFAMTGELPEGFDRGGEP